jgi:signal transduction histidine kinase
MAIQLCVEGEGTIWVLADPQQVKQALINLIQNAAENIVRNGLITLRVRQETTNFPAGAHPAVVLQVADTGKGIPPEVQKRLFDPFFSTKKGGTGLGLAIAARIVEKHGGLLRYQTELQRGTQFEIVLPGIDNDANQNPNH